MRHYYPYMVIFLFWFCCTSCTFDPREPKVYKITGHYYASFDTNAPNDGLTIKHEEKEDFFTTVASNCISIYKDTIVILFSENDFNNDTTNIDYYMITAATTDKPKKIAAVAFKNLTKNLQRIQVTE